MPLGGAQAFPASKAAGFASKLTGGITMCPAIPISTLYGAGTDKWNASAYGALSVAWRVSTSVRVQANILSLSRNVWKLDGILRHFLEEIYKAAENPPARTEPITKEQIMEAANTLQQIHRTIDQLYARAKSAGLTNRGFIGTALNSVKVRGEELLEFGDALEMSLNEDVDTFLEHSLEDLRSGNVHDLPAFK
jgi:hypothetical protein